MTYIHLFIYVFMYASIYLFIRTSGSTIVRNRHNKKITEKQMHPYYLAEKANDRRRLKHQEVWIQM